MTNAAHKIAGPLLRDVDISGKRKRIATPVEVGDALFGLVHHTVRREWVNEAYRKNGLLGTSEIAGREFRTEHHLRRQPKPKLVAYKPLRLSRLQRIARALTYFFRRHS